MHEANCSCAFGNAGKNRLCIAKVMAALRSLSCESVCSFLKGKIPSLSENIMEKLKQQKIDGEVLLELDEDYLRELAPLMGDRLKLKKVIMAEKSKVYLNFFYDLFHSFSYNFFFQVLSPPAASCPKNSSTPSSGPSSHKSTPRVINLSQYATINDR